MKVTPKLYPRSSELFERNRRVIPGGVVSLNRAVEPEIAFVRGQGSRLWDLDGNEYIDYHAAFACYLLGHNDPDVNAAVVRTIQEQQTLAGSGTSPAEGRLAELLVEHIPAVEQVQLTNTGSEATFHAIRLARAYTGRDGIVIMQGGYNGWHNDVAFNVMTPLEILGSRRSPGEYDPVPITAGIPSHIASDVHVVNFNDLPSVEYVLEQHSIACVLLEPILQNIGVVKPRPGYLAGLRELCDRHGALLIFDEVKTGFRYALGGYQSISGVLPDICVFGKAMANGYPIAAVGGRKDIMALFVDPDPNRRVMIAGTYNAHPVSVAAAIATIEKLARHPELYDYLESLGQRMEAGLREICAETGLPAFISRQGSAFCLYFMDHEPVDWHDVAEHHDMDLDVRFRRLLIEAGIYFFPVATKQCSISAAHTKDDIDLTLERARQVISRLASGIP